VPYGVYYDNSAGLWAIFTEDGSEMPENAAFNVLIIKTGGGIE
jgi:hypothetical protein